MNSTFHPEALKEYEAAAKYYADQEDGLELRFIESVEDAIAQICDAPLRWPVFDVETRRHLVRVFPYSIIYVSDESAVLILAVMHQSQRPGYWRERLR